MKTFYKNIITPIIISLTLFSTCAHADTNTPDWQLFDKIFSDWSAAFDRKDLDTCCALFSKAVVADYQGAVQKNYASLCDGFKKLFDNNKQHFQYSYTLHDVYRSGDLAALRVTWNLKVQEGNQNIATTTDEGIDIFEKDPTGKWVIVNYIGYEVIPSACKIAHSKHSQQLVRRS